MPENPKGSVRIWRVPVRILHWTLASLIAVAWLTDHGPAVVHDWAGYLVLAAIGIRVSLGFLGTPAERFTRFLPGWRLTGEYAGSVLAGREKRYLGHNPLGSWMILALLLVATATGLSGWLYTTDRFWGVAWVEAGHGLLADLLLALVALHIAGVLITSLRQGENLVAAMIHGRKPRTTARHPEAPVDP